MKSKIKFSIKNSILFLFLFAEVLLKFSECSKDDESCNADTCVDRRQKCRHFDPKYFGPHNKSIIFGEPRGRIGNQLLGYAVMFQLRRQLDVDTFITSTCRDFISHTFTPENVELPVFSEYFCNPEDLKLEPYNGPLADLLNDESFRRGKLIDFYPTDPQDFLKGGYKPEQHVGPEQDAFQNGYLTYIQQNFRFKPHIIKRVRKTLKSMAKKLGLKTKEVTYVGIHNRRTDHFQLVKRITGQAPLDKDFFYDAMDYFREEYDNVAFAYVSDDMAWGKKKLKNKHGDLFFVGAGENLDENGNEIVDPDAAIFDLALLANCNHTIITRGTFSMWAALLAGGEYYTEYGTIVPTYLQG